MPFGLRGGVEMDILELLSGQLNSQKTLSRLGKSVGADSSQVQQLAQIAMPTLLQALGRNASTDQGARSLAGALDQHSDDGVDDIDDFLDRVDTNDGAKMLQHIFSGKSQRVETRLAAKTGMDSGQVSGLLTQLAPLLLGTLGQTKKRQNLDSGGIAELLGQLLGQGDGAGSTTAARGSSAAGGGGLMSMLTEFLDADDDGSIVDDVGNLLGGLFKQ